MKVKSGLITGIVIAVAGAGVAAWYEDKNHKATANISMVFGEGDRIPDWDDEPIISLIDGYVYYEMRQEKGAVGISKGSEYKIYYKTTSSKKYKIINAFVATNNSTRWINKTEFICSNGYTDYDFRVDRTRGVGEESKFAMRFFLGDEFDYASRVK